MVSIRVEAEPNGSHTHTFTVSHLEPAQVLDLTEGEQYSLTTVVDGWGGLFLLAPPALFQSAKASKLPPQKKVDSRRNQIKTIFAHPSPTARTHQRPRWARTPLPREGTPGRDDQTSQPTTRALLLGHWKEREREGESASERASKR